MVSSYGFTVMYGGTSFTGVKYACILSVANRMSG